MVEKIMDAYDIATKRPRQKKNISQADPKILML
jgi:hypothetical protein